MGFNDSMAVIVVLTGIVCPPCKLLMAACASAWLENFTNAQPVNTEKERGKLRKMALNIWGKYHSLPLCLCHLVCKYILSFVC